MKKSSIINTIEKEEKSLINQLSNIMIMGAASIYMLALNHASFFQKFAFIIFGK